MARPKRDSISKELPQNRDQNWTNPFSLGIGDTMPRRSPPSNCLSPDPQLSNLTSLIETTGSGDTSRKMPTPPAGFSKFNNPLVPIITSVPWTQDLDLNRHDSISTEASDVEATINRMTADLDRFQIQSPPPEVLPLNIPAGGNMEVMKTLTPPQRELDRDSERGRDRRTTNVRSRLTRTRRQEAIAGNRSNATDPDDNQILYRDLDDQRRQLTLRKAACTFTYGALKIQGERVLQLQRRLNSKTEECAARIILHNLILNLYRKGQTQLKQISGDNQQLEKSVENLCLQLRVVRHLQSAEKERTIEKAHEITTLRSEVNYVKKQLSKAKSELERVEKECETAQLSNEKIHEEKTKLQRELRSLEDRKEMLQGSLGLERKRCEKHMTEIRGLKRTINELRLQITELTTQSDTWQERARTFESKNWECQLLLEARGKEFTELGRHRDALKIQYDEMKDENDKLFKRNTELERHMRQNQKETLKLKKSLTTTEAQLEQHVGRIGYLENAVIDIRHQSSIMRSELMDHKLKNLRRRRAWVSLSMVFTHPFQTLVKYVYGDSEPTQYKPNVAYKFQKPQHQHMWTQFGS